MNKSISITILLFVLSSLLLLSTGCGSVGRMITIATQLGRDCEQLKSMELSEIEKLISPDVDINRIKNDPEGILGQYVRLKGKADIKGTKDFPLDISTGKPNQGAEVFILENTVFVITLKEYPELKQDDMVEIIGLVSKSRFLKATAELYPEEKYPDLVTVIAKEVKVIKPEEPPVEEKPKEESAKASDDEKEIEESKENQDNS
jgi:hypothetical protein